MVYGGKLMCLIYVPLEKKPASHFPSEGGEGCGAQIL